MYYETQIKPRKKYAIIHHRKKKFSDYDFFSLNKQIVLFELSLKCKRNIYFCSILLLGKKEEKPTLALNYK